MRPLTTSRIARAIAVVPLLCAVAMSAQADELFSRRPLRSALDGSAVIAPPPTTPASPGSTGSADLAAITQILEQAGYEVQTRNESGLSIRVAVGERKLPLAVSFSGDYSQLWLAMILNTVSDVSELSAEQLIGLMDANRKFGPAFFTFDRESKRIELRRAVPNSGLDAEALKQQIDVLTSAAKETASLWARGVSAEQSPSRPADAREIGRWVAELADGQGFALRFESDGSFVLVHRRADGGTEESKGNYTLSGNTLRLEGTDQPALQGTVTFAGNDTFTFVIGSGSGLRFERK